ncbi:SNF2 family domain-containing protein [Sodiomyces alkalinus F11]|uniref:SNF2 family domain-containing protein n=1 Tax=Sodiomyces alkalinus (strain CBS 110278 / VKM F-3762 / F11) TaxID=1314773 RepID=A0A3N2PLR8_SODAK|nr:SNF2 family domain-containing protein [Sodiomyces alkalinus F11]ROT35462.1 SNF2 family domain-containing protein [Sodiomyces alkalinus F11]
MDELTTDTVPCSPYVTQVTQIVPRTTLAPQSADVSSPVTPRSIVEVPASSPFRSRPDDPRSSPPRSTAPFASRLAPAGTSFRPPPAVQTASRGIKRPAAEPVLISSDDEDQAKATRGEIRPTAFKKHVSAFSYVPVDELQEKVDSVFDALSHTIPRRLCREALAACQNNVNDAINYLVEGKHLNRLNFVPNKSSSSHLKTSESSKPAKPSAPVSSKVSKHFASAPAMETKPKPRRRLVQGRRPNRSPTPPSQPVAQPAIEDFADIDELAHEHILLSDDKDDDYDDMRGEIAESAKESLQDKALNTINMVPIEDLAAMTNMKQDELKAIVSKRPFHDIPQVERVTVPKKGSRKSAKFAIGEVLVEAIMEFTKATNAIDDVVAECERNASRVKDETSQWDLDFKGQKRSVPPVSDPELPLTPNSLKGQKYMDPPIPRQPRLMDGHCEMRPFQLYGLNWMSLLYKSRYGCILADEMGLGKTCQVISLVAHFVESYDEDRDAVRPWPNLVVVPPSTLSNWEAEFEKFAPDLSVLVYQGPRRQDIAEEMLSDPEQYHVVLTSYSQVGKEEDIEALAELRPNAAIFDEGHKMKNPKTKIYKDLIRIKAQWRMLLTGTPVQNNLMEMLALLNFIDPKMFKPHMEHLQYMFSQKVTFRDVNNGAFLYGERVNRARNILEPFILQRRKYQVVTDMPAKVCNVVYCDLAPAQKDLYESYEKLFKSEPSTRNKANARQNDQNNPWIQLRKAAVHPQLFRRYFDDKKVEAMAKVLMRKVPQTELQQPHLHHLIGELKNCSDFELHLWCRDYPCLAEFDVPDRSWMESGKVTKLLELIHKYEQNGDRVLVFSKFAKVIEILREVLFSDGVKHCVLYGATSVDERQNLINEFNENKDITAFLLTTGAGGTGINLTSANKVIIFDQSDNPQDDIQAENRAHRLGQKREVEVIRLLTSHTIEELIYKACTKKVELANKVTGATEEEMSKNAEANLEKEVRKMMKDQLTPP